MLKNRICTVLLMLILLAPVYAEPEETDDITSAPNVQEEVAETTMPAEEPVFKQPISKRKIAKKFLFAMSGVAISSILLFMLLSLYNKVREAFSAPQENPEGETSLVTPDNLNEAVKTFLDKTKWD